jgi:hypothetical protein
VRRRRSLCIDADDAEEVHHAVETDSEEKKPKKWLEWPSGFSDAEFL